MPIDAQHNEFPRPALTKIVATIGPTSSHAPTIAKLIDAGVSIFRINFSHGSFELMTEWVKAIRSTARELARPIAVLGDLQGPKIRVGRVPPEGVSVNPGEQVAFGHGDFVAEAGAGAKPHRFASTYPGLVDDVEVGQRVLVNDGAVRMLVIAKSRDQLTCTVTPGGGGLITNHKGMNLPDSTLRVPSMSDRDWEHVEWSLRHGLDFLALSFVRCANDVIQLRDGIERIAKAIGANALEDDSTSREAFEFVQPSNPESKTQNPKSAISIVAKIETPQAVAQIDSIIDAADGLMVARGDLGVEMDLTQVPVIQKRLIATAERYGKPCIVATQMLESMMSSASPTRAEASDVANAILDGADAVMLSGETAVGKYPVVTVTTMRRIAEHTERYLAQRPARESPPQKLVESRYRTAALAHGVWTVAYDIGAKFIVVWSQQGGGARYLSQNDFTIPIIAITSDERAARRMQLLKSVTPLVMPRPEGLAHFTRMVDAYLLDTGWAREGDVCVLVAGGAIGIQGVTNSLAIHAIGDPQGGYAQVRG